MRHRAKAQRLLPRPQADDVRRNRLTGGVARGQECEGRGAATDASFLLVRCYIASTLFSKVSLTAKYCRAGPLTFGLLEESGSLDLSLFDVVQPTAVARRQKKTEQENQPKRLRCHQQSVILGNP